MSFIITPVANFDLTNYTVAIFESSGAGYRFCREFVNGNAKASALVNFEAGNVATIRRALCKLAGINGEIVEGKTTKKGKPVYKPTTTADAEKAMAKLGITLHEVAKDGKREFVQLKK